MLAHLKAVVPGRRALLPLALGLLLALAASAAAVAGGKEPAAPVAAQKLKVFGAFATPIEEPWDGVIHTALTKAKNAGEIDYSFADDIGYSGDMERVLRQV